MQLWCVVSISLIYFTNVKFARSRIQEKEFSITVKVSAILVFLGAKILSFG